VAGQHADYLRLPVEDFMTTQPETVSGSDTLAFALHKMDVGGYRQSSRGEKRPTRGRGLGPRLAAPHHAPVQG